MSEIKNNIFVSNLQVTDISSEGKGVARSESKVLFIQGAVPGDVVTARITKNKKDFAEAIVSEIISPSPDRVKPFCEHFGTCGGCKLQHFNYNAQLRYKQQQVEEAFKRIGGITLNEVIPILGCETNRFYRNRLDFSFSNQAWIDEETWNSSAEILSLPALGFHLPKLFHKILDIKNCYLQPEPSNTIRLAVKKFAVDNNLSFFDPIKQIGLLRNITIRNTLKGEVMVTVVFRDDEEEKIIVLMDFLKESFPVISSLNYIINQKRNDTVYDLEVINYSGADAIYEELDGLQFRISPKSFFQTNSSQAKNLYNIAIDFAGLKKDDVVYDLYTGTGSIALFAAKHCKTVYGIEQTAEAIDDAKINATINNSSNAFFFTGDTNYVLDESFIAQSGKPDVIITDPPRNGMHKDVVEKILSLNPNRIVYVSCNPSTQARDAQLLAEKYTVVKIQPVDMFPHTQHVENVALLVRSSN
jgi:23S rRNA (uracil1939-C5)-methyltransferase